MKNAIFTLFGALTLTCAALPVRAQELPDTLSGYEQVLEILLPDSTAVVAPPDSIIRLTEEDYRQVAERLGIEVAAMKAVVDIEAGKTHEGFSAPGKPLVNFDLSMFRRHASKRRVNLARYYKSHPEVFRGSRATQAAVNRRLDAARRIDPRLAIEGTFWGMFQIGGFNWKLCGCESIEEFEQRMSRSERDQLELFANFITASGLLKHLKNKNWAAFARGYNGPGYARHSYHTRMANAYARHKRAENNASKK